MNADALAKQLGLHGKDEYFEHIMESIRCGQSFQARELYEDMSSDDAEDFFTWAADYYYYDADTEREMALAIDNLKSILIN